MSQQIFINDLGLGRTQKAVWRYALERHFPPENLQLYYLSELNLDLPANWQVKPEVALSLAAKLWAFQEPASQGRLLYFDGNLLFQGNLRELLAIEPLGWLQAPQNLPIARWSFFWIDASATQRKAAARQLGQLAATNYGKLAEFSHFDSQPLPQQWYPVVFGENPAANLIDCRIMGERPWYRAFAPSGKLWARQLRSAMEKGYLSLDDIHEDVARGIVRPSLLWQMEQEIDNPFELPAVALTADRAFVLPEFVVSPEQQQMIETTIFPFPGRALHRLLLSPEYLFKFELPHQINRILGILRKILFKLGVN